MTGGFLPSVSAILVRFLSLRSAIAPIQSDGGFCQPEPIAWLKAEMQEPMSPMTGAAMATLLSASVGEMSTWMNCCLPASLDDAPPQVLPLPCESSQLRRAPTSITTSASARTYERAAEADRLWLSGSRPLAMDIGRYGMPLFSTKALMSASACAYAAPLPRITNGFFADLSRSIA